MTTEIDTDTIHRSRYWYDYNTWARTYDDDVHGSMQYRGHIMVAEKITPFMQASAARHLADLGTGTGLVLCLLRQDFPQAVMNGYDFSPAMLKKCRIKNVADSLTECDLTDRDWPIRPESVDFVTSAGLLDMVRNVGQFLSNVEHILKPGGVAALTYEVRMLEKKGFLVRPSAEARSPEEMDRLATETGFDIVDHDISQGYITPGKRFQYGVMTLHKPAP